MRTIGTLCDAWWDNLDQEKKNAVWILMQMVREMKIGTRIEFRRGPEQFEADIVETAGALNTGSFRSNRRPVPSHSVSKKGRQEHSPAP